MIYSQYIDGGLIPMALTLEEINLQEVTKNLFDNSSKKRERVDALTFKKETEMTDDFNPAKYIMITGDK